jgi:hypothetical protein
MTPGGIEAQEKQGQTDLIKAGMRLPKQFGNYKPADDGYRAHGIEILGEYDDIFYVVKLPPGWKLVATKSSYYTILVDGSGNERAEIFYKAAFYDRHAHISFKSLGTAE